MADQEYYDAAAPAGSARGVSEEYYDDRSVAAAPMGSARGGEPEISLGFKNIKPMTREERRALKDKVALEKDRLMKRTGHQAKMYRENCPQVRMRVAVGDRPRG